MSQRLKVIAVLAVWFLATGSQWDLVQTFGWARMMTTYAKSMSFVEAAKKTFSGEMCGVCEFVNDAKQHQADRGSVPAQDKIETKLPAILAPSAVVFYASVKTESWSPTDLIAPSAERAVPLLPPPRA